MAKKKRPVAKKIAEAPTSSCLIFCEDVTISVGKQLHTLHGVITDMYIPQLPALTGVGVVYMRLRNVYANQQFSLRFANLDSSEVLFEFGAQSGEASDPLGNHVIILNVPPFIMPCAGRYVFSAVHGDTTFAECVINVIGSDQREK